MAVSLAVGGSVSALKVQKIMRLMRLARVIKLIRGFKVGALRLEEGGRNMGV